MNKKIIIGIILALIVGVGGWTICTDNSNGDAKAMQDSTSEKNSGSTEKKDQEEDSDEISSSDDNSLETSDSEARQNSSTDNKESSSSNKENGESSSKEEVNISTYSSMKLPYTISDADVKIEKIKGYSGEFVEDGSDKKVSNILSLVVKNTSKKDIQYCSIEMKMGDNKKATFNITNLPSGKTMTVLESSGKITYKSSNTYNVTNCTYSGVDKLPMNSEKVKISTKASNITIKNISGEDLGTVYVYYKNMKNDSYLGGITYRAKFENVIKGEELTAKTTHFSKDNSKIVMVDTES